MKRRVFYSFHYVPDNSLASAVEEAIEIRKKTDSPIEGHAIT